MEAGREDVLMRASGYDRVASDWYVEPEWVVDALLNVEEFPGLCWDPACGGGTIPVALGRRSIPCVASDIVDRGCPGGMLVQDFFEAAERVAHIISNPPYGCLEQFVLHALSLAAGKVAVLARLAFLEGQARQMFFRQTPFARVWVSSRRVSMPPGGSGVPAKGGSIAYAWFIWDHAHKGPPTLGWLP